MRVLVVHNRYSSRVPSGENLAVDDEVSWLRDAGLDVARHEVSNDDVVDAGAVGRVRQAVGSVWGRAAAADVARTIERVQPDVVHVHNLFPLLTASVPWASRRRHLPTVWTVHNLRLTCVAGTHFRAGGPCHECRPGRRLAGVRYGCYADSRSASALITAATSVFGRLARRQLTAIAISEHLRSWLTSSARFPADRTRVKYNGVAGPGPDVTLSPAESSRSFVFAGHLSSHKGIDLLLEAWRRAELPTDVWLDIAGDGPQADAVKAEVSGDSRVRWHGLLDPTETSRLIARSRAVVVPSTWDEPFGRAAAEALAHARPVVTTGTGGLAEIVDPASGWITGVDPDELARALEHAATDDAAIASKAASGGERHAKLFSPAATTEQLVQIYAEELARA